MEDRRWREMEMEEEEEDKMEVLYPAISRDQKSPIESSNHKYQYVNINTHFQIHFQLIKQCSLNHIHKYRTI
jgi:hypothetical protein